jgi:hypothetical protein
MRALLVPLVLASTACGPVGSEVVYHFDVEIFDTVVDGEPDTIPDTVCATAAWSGGDPTDEVVWSYQSETVTVEAALVADGDGVTIQLRDGDGTVAATAEVAGDAAAGTSTTVEGTVGDREVSATFVVVEGCD